MRLQRRSDIASKIFDETVSCSSNAARVLFLRQFHAFLTRGRIQLLMAYSKLQKKIKLFTPLYRAAKERVDERSDVRVSKRSAFIAALHRRLCNCVNAACISTHPDFASLVLPSLPEPAKRAERNFFCPSLSRSEREGKTSAA